MQLLKQSTAATVKLGPFVDSTDGVTAETGLTISQADIRLSKNGAAFAQTNNATGATHDEAGWYGVPLDTTDTATLGRLTVSIQESGALPVWAEYLVVPANVYDSLVSGSDYLQADAVQVEGADATDTILGALVDDATRIDASALNTLSGYAPASTIAAASDIPTANITAILADTNELQTDWADGGRLDLILDSVSVSGVAASVWAYATRTLTQSAASVMAAVSGSDITVYRGTTWDVSITGLGDISTYDTIYFSVKESAEDSDDNAVLRVKDNASGLLRWQKAAVGTATNGYITIDDASAGDITITVLEAETDDAAVMSGYVYDIKGVDDDGKVDLISIGGTFSVLGDVTRAIT